jgi:GxxExxY protein
LEAKMADGDAVIVESIDTLITQTEANARAVHAELGHGLTESIYRDALAVALRADGLGVSVETPIVVQFRGHAVGAIRADIVVSSGCCRVVVELKNVTKINDSHVAQARAYAVRLDGRVGGVVVNFGAASVETRIVDV